MQPNRWSSAATSGLILSLITILVMTTQYAFNSNNIGLNIVITITKLIANIWLLSYLIKEYAKPVEIFTYKDGFTYGTIVCLFSSFICAVASLVLMHLFADSFNEQMETVITAYSTVWPDIAEQMSDMLESGKMPLFISAEIGRAHV